MSHFDKLEILYRTLPIKSNNVNPSFGRDSSLFKGKIESTYNVQSPRKAQSVSLLHEQYLCLSNSLIPSACSEATIYSNQVPSPLCLERKLEGHVENSSGISSYPDKTVKVCQFYFQYLQQKTTDARTCNAILTKVSC